ncbi:MAG: TrkH family potassium uptake protein [Ignavibacteriales bacterium]
MLTGIPFSIYYDADDIVSLLISSFVTMLVGTMLWFTSRVEHETEISKRDAYLIVTLSWLASSAFATLPFLIHGSITNFSDAFFEMMSGFTTTGSSIISDVEALPHGLLFWRSMTHWLGGMGIIVLSLAILPLLGIGGMQLFQAEVAGPSKEKLHPRVTETAKRLWAIYTLLTFIEVVLLMFGGMNLFDAMCHSFGTMATGGFSTKNTSIAYFNSPFIEYVIIFFMFLGGTNFTLHYLALHGKLNSYFKDEEFKFYFTFILLTVSLTACYLFFVNNQAFESSFRDAAFSIMTVLSSTGFATVDYEAWAPFFTQFFLILLLFGACAGSTSGGVKMIRYHLLIKNSFLELKRLLHPNAIVPVRYNNRTVSSDIISKISSFVLLYLAIFGISSIVMAFLGLELQSAMGSVAASMANIGPGLGSTGPVSNYSHVPEVGKWVLSLLMLIGRLEIFTILIIFSPTFWKK